MPESNDHPGFLCNLAIAITTLAFWRYAAAMASGLLLSAAFPPFCWNLLGWVAVVPLLFVPQPRTLRQRCLVGYIFGYAHFASCLLWLNEVGFGAGFLLALYCALFPMLWYVFVCMLLGHFRDLKAEKLPGVSFLYIKSPFKLLLVALFGACAWTALEWLRSTLFTGFSWNQLGISQYERNGIIQIAAYTGVYGVSFFMMFTNLILTIEASTIAWMFLARRPHTLPYHFITLTILLIPICICSNLPHALPTKDTPTFDAMAVQGNLPMMRYWSEDTMKLAMDTYMTLTRDGFKAIQDKPQLIIWPESAVPAPLNYEPFRIPRNAFMTEFPDQQFLIGAIHHRYNSEDPQNNLVFNSVFLLDPTASAKCKLFEPVDHIVDYYDKVHRVPFGEYTPGARFFPWLPGLIGMGRDLTPGSAFHPITIKNGAKLGVNICFEDAFPEVSRNLTQNGAQILMSVSDDAWYNHSAGAHQHFSHAIFRAVENRRPFLRCGSNSHTAYISPNGVISPILRDNQNDSDFVAGTQVFELPIHDVNAIGFTFYTQYGDVFARLMLLATLAALTWMAHATLEKHRRLLAEITVKSTKKPAAKADEKQTPAANTTSAHTEK